MQLFGNKKAAEIAWNTTVYVILAVIVAFVVIAIFYSGVKRQKTTSDGFIDGLEQDCDRDGVRNIVDKCPCSPDNDPTNGQCATNVNNCPEYTCPGTS